MRVMHLGVPFARGDDIVIPSHPKIDIISYEIVWEDEDDDWAAHGVDMTIAIHTEDEGEADRIVADWMPQAFDLDE